MKDDNSYSFIFVVKWKEGKVFYKLLATWNIITLCVITEEGNPQGYKYERDEVSWLSCYDARDIATMHAT
jgi:hypothetical protein